MPRFTPIGRLTGASSSALTDCLHRASLSARGRLWISRNSLPLVFVCLIVMVAAVGFVGLGEMARIHAGIENIGVDQFATLKLARRAVRLSAQNNRITLQVFLMHDRADIARLLAERTANTGSISALLKQLAPRAETAQARELLDSVVATRATYVASYKYAVTLLLENRDRDAASQAMVQTTIPNLVRYQAAWETFAQNQMDETDRLIQESRVRYGAARRQTLGLVAGAILCAIGIATFAVRKLAREVATRTGAEAALRKSHEELETRVEERTRDLASVNISLQSEMAGRKRAQEQLVLRDSALQAAANAITIVDRQGLIVWANPAFSRLSGYSVEEVIGQNPRILKSGRHGREVYQQMWETILRGEVWQGELTNRRKDGSLYPEEMTITPMRGEDGQITHFIAIKLDITERKRTEVDLAAARDAALAATRSKSQFLANMSHEIRTPMNGVIGMTSLLLDTPLTLEQREFTETIRTSGESLLTVINDILDFSKIEAGKLSLEILDFDLQEVVERTVELFAETAHRKGLELSGFTDPSMPTLLRGDAGRLRQVLTNLVGNGIKFTAVGEVTLSIELACETDTEATLTFRVHDTGIGIAPEAQHKLFEAFNQADVSTTRKFGGTGLGLAISKQLIESMGGEMGLESAPSAGSTFWFSLPLAKQAVAQRVRENGHALQDVRVLIVDDNATNLLNLQTQLSAWHLQSEVARSGESALEILRTAATTTTPFTIAVIDQEMPRMDGLELARTIKADPSVATIRLVLLTSRGQRLAEEDLQSAGIVQSRLKPVRQSMLFDCLVNALAESPAILAAASSPALPVNGRRSERILLAEDNAVNQRVALGQLRKLGYAADAVANGFEALEALNQLPYDIVLMDCHMPELDGYEATGAIRQREGTDKHTWIIAMTANAMNGDREQCLAAGMDDYVCKPVRLDDLAVVLERAGRHISATPAVDPRSLGELRHLPDENGRSMLQNLLSRFIEDAPAALTELRAAIERVDARAVAFAAHALKGSSGTFGAYRLQELLGEMERVGKARNVEPFQNLLTSIEAELQRVVTSLARELEPRPA